MPLDETTKNSDRLRWVGEDDVTVGDRFLKRQTTTKKHKNKGNQEVHRDKMGKFPNSRIGPSPSRETKSPEKRQTERKNGRHKNGVDDLLCHLIVDFRLKNKSR